MESRKQCIVCDHNTLAPYISTTDFHGTKESFELLQCPKCSTVYTNPYPNALNSIKYYKSNSYVSHGDSKGFIFDSIYSFLRRINITYKYRILTKYIQPSTHLDIGCGTGDFLDYLTSKSIKAYGIEIDEDAKKIANSKGLSLVFSSIHDLDHVTFDSVSMIHVLEHIHDIENHLRFIVNHLNSNGLLLLALPNYLSHDAQFFNQYWAGYDVPRHLYHFTPQSIKKLSQKIGLKLVATHPMKLDSFYVSLLSHQYRRGRSNIPQALYNGLKSNIKAKRTGNYSSLIYILQK